MPEFVPCHECPRTVEYADLSELYKTLDVIEAECVLGGKDRCWLAWAAREGYLRDVFDVHTRKAAFRLGMRLGHYPLAASAVAWLERVGRWPLRLVRWAAIVGAILFGIWLAIEVIAELNYAPLWFRVYNACVDRLPEANSITEAIQQRQECKRGGERVVREQMKLDQASRQ